MTEISCQFYQYNPIINMNWTKNKNITDEQKIKTLQMKLFSVQCFDFGFFLIQKDIKRLVLLSLNLRISHYKKFDLIYGEMAPSSFFLF